MKKNILCIGNSFSMNATRYLHDIARAGGDDFEVANLYVAGCPLERHYRNMHADTREYELQYNGHRTGFFVTLKEALLSRQWDIVTLQQASKLSVNIDTYLPYLQSLVEYVRLCQPKAKIVIHETWAYEEGCTRLATNAGCESAAEMLARLTSAYRQAAELIHADGLIPSGELFGRMLSCGIEQLHEDTTHASKGLGCYALGLLWYHVISGADVTENAYCDFDRAIPDAEIAIAKKCVMEFDPCF